MFDTFHVIEQQVHPFIRQDKLSTFLHILEDTVLLITHHKNLLIGDVLVDDSNYRGQPDFKGKWLWFGKQSNKDWNETLKIC